MERILKGLQIIAKYPGNHDFSADHDVIYVGDSNQFSEEDLLEMDELDWFWDEEVDCWSHYC